MIRIALSSIITLCSAASIVIAADHSTPYIVIAMLVLSGAVAGAFIMYAADSSSEVK